MPFFLGNKEISHAFSEGIPRSNAAPIRNAVGEDFLWHPIDVPRLMILAAVFYQCGDYSRLILHFASPFLWEDWHRACLYG